MWHSDIRETSKSMSGDLGTGGIFIYPGNLEKEKIEEYIYSIDLSALQ